MHAWQLELAQKTKTINGLKSFFQDQYLNRIKSIDSFAAATGYTGGNHEIELTNTEITAWVKSDDVQRNLLAELMGATRPIVLTFIDTDSALKVHLKLISSCI